MRFGPLLAFLFACSRSPQEPPSSSTPVKTPAASTSAAPVASLPPPPSMLDPFLKRGEEKPVDMNSEPWNPKGIAWQPFDEGLTQARKSKKPVCLVLFTNTCPHCKNYSHVFGDPRVASAAKSFVMIKVDADADSTLSKKYAPDGEYVPRTLFLNGNGDVDPNAISDHPRYRHFFDESHAESLLEAMNDALQSPLRTR